jgi:transposase
LTVRYGRRSRLLHRMLEAIAVALAGRAGARLAHRLAAPVSRMTLLRMVRALPELTPTDVTAVGVDDFALRRGHVYGTVVIDGNSHRPLDVLPDRTAATLEDWLKRHPGVRIVCRDRAGAYAEAANAGAPAAVQVADRWHLWHNLAQAVEKTVIARRDDLVEPPPEDDDQPRAVERATPAVYTEPVENRLAMRTRQRHEAIRKLRSQGTSISAICRQLDLDRKTVRRFAQATDVEQLLVRARSRASLLDAFKPYLHERFNAGHTDAATLTAEIKTLGYRGSAQTVRRYLHPFRATLVAPPAKPLPPSVRQVTGWLTRRPSRLSEEERLDLKKILDRSDALTTTHRQVRDFPRCSPRGTVNASATGCAT